MSQARPPVCAIALFGLLAMHGWGTHGSAGQASGSHQVSMLWPGDTPDEH
jgi:hypothetical protein